MELPSEEALRTGIECIEKQIFKIDYKFILDLKQQMLDKVEESQRNADNACSNYSYYHFISQKEVFKYVANLIDNYLEENK